VNRNVSRAKLKGPVQSVRHTMGQHKETLEKKTFYGYKKLHFSKLPPTKSQMILNAYQSPNGISNEGQSYAKDRLTKTPKKRKTKLTMIRMTIKYKLYKLKKQTKNPSKQKQYTLK
jgi:hypothetical protein